MQKRPFIIDCDTGTDDAIAIIAALYSEEVTVRAITSVNGNVEHKYVCHNNLNLMEYLDQKVPVAKGANMPFRDNGLHSHDGTHSMDHILCRQIVSLRQDSLPGGLLITRAVLHLSAVHIVTALLPQFNARRAVYRIVDAAMTGNEASQHLGIRRVHDRADLKPGDIPLPD